MKKIYQFSIFLFIPALVLFLAFTTGPPAGYSGSPLDGNNCTNCHEPGPAHQVSGWITSSIPVSGYTPGESYMVTVTAIDISAEKMGFQISSETPVAKVGTFMITDPTRTKLTNIVTVTHTAAGTSVAGLPNSWSMDWKAPVAGSGPLSFYVAVNVTNNNGGNDGDIIYVSSLTVDESTFGIAENLDDAIGILYPNPAQDFITLDLPNNATLRVYDNNGRNVMDHMHTGGETIDISDLNEGMYLIQIQYNDQFATRKFVKR